MMRAYRVAYDGRPYYGFQRQPSVSTVEGELLTALGKLDLLAGDDAEKEGLPPGYAAAGRTDAGVSAVAQTIAFEAPTWATPRALNSMLPGTVRAWAAAEVDREFHATLAASRREYTYHLHAPGGDVDRANAAATALSGEHDFHNLTSDERGTVRDVTATVDRDGDYLVCQVTAGGFPRGFVRRFVSVVEEVATRRAELDRVDEVLGEESLSGESGVARAPPEPLVLTDVVYPGVEFVRDDEAAESAHDAFEAARLETQTRERVVRSLRDGVG
jgi:tRNA pseudouridine38-40 synthase